MYLLVLQAAVVLPQETAQALIQSTVYHLKKSQTGFLQSWMSDDDLATTLIFLKTFSFSQDECISTLSTLWHFSTDKRKVLLWSQNIFSVRPCSNHLLLTLFGIFSFSFLHDNKAPRNKTGLWSDLRAVAADCIHLKMYDGLKSIFSHINYQWKRSANRVVTQNFRTNHIRNIIIWTMQTKLHMLLLNPPLIIPLKQFHHQNMIV